LNIGHFVPVHPDRTGVSAAIDGLAEALEELGHTSVVYAYTRGAGQDATRPPRSRQARLRDRVLYFDPLPVAGDRVARTILADVDHLDALVLHGVFTGSVARLSRTVSRRARSLPIVAYPHEPYDDAQFANKRFVKEAWFRLFERPYLQRSALIMLAAPGQERWLRRRGVSTRTAVAPLGLRRAEVAQAARVRACRSPGVQGPLRCLVLGRYDVYDKGIDLILEAMAAMPGEVALHLVGPEIGARAEVEALVRHHGVGETQLDGFTDNVWAPLAEADALVLASRKEGFGLVALQALAAGIPVLLSEVCGIAEHLRSDDPVVLVDPDTGSVRAGLRPLNGDNASGETSS
jgi:glycosyltransferase involved in cell wall biosynthesis